MVIRGSKRFSETFAKNTALALKELREERERQNPVIDSLEGKNSSIYLIQYLHTTGIIMRESRDPVLISNCIDSPQESLEYLFPNYHITEFNGYSFFDSGDFEETTPMIGIGIKPFAPPKGCMMSPNSKLESLTNDSEFLKVKRSESISQYDLNRIVEGIDPSLDDRKDFGPYGPTYNNPRYDQSVYDRNQILDILKKFE